MDTYISLIGEINNLLKNLSGNIPHLNLKENKLFEELLKNKTILLNRLNSETEKTFETIKTIEGFRKKLNILSPFLKVKKDIFQLFLNYMFINLKEIEVFLTNISKLENKEDFINEIKYINSSFKNINLFEKRKDFPEILYAFLKRKEGIEKDFFEMINKNKKIRNDYTNVKRGLLFYLWFSRKSSEKPFNRKKMTAFMKYVYLIEPKHTSKKVVFPSMNLKEGIKITQITDKLLHTRKNELLESYNTSEGQIIFVRDFIFEPLNLNTLTMKSFYSCLSSEFKKAMNNWSLMRLPFDKAELLINLKPEDYKKYNTPDGQIRFVRNVIFKLLKINNINMGSFYSCLSSKFKKEMTEWNLMRLLFDKAESINNLKPGNYKGYNTPDGQIRFVKNVIFKLLKINNINMGSFYSCLSSKFKKEMTEWNLMQFLFDEAESINNLEPGDYKGYNTPDGQIRFVRNVIFKLLKINHINMGNFYTCLSSKFKKEMTEWKPMQLSFDKAESINNLKPEDYKKYNTPDGQIRFVKNVILDLLKINNINMRSFYSCLSSEFKKAMNNWNLMRLSFDKAELINDLEPGDYEEYNTSDGQIRFVRNVIFKLLKINNINMGSFYSCLSSKFKKEMTEWNLMRLLFDKAESINNLKPGNYKGYNTPDGQIRFVKNVIFKLLKINNISMESFYSCLSSKFKKEMTEWNLMQLLFDKAESINNLKPEGYEEYNTPDGQIRFVKNVILDLLKINNINMRSFYSCLSSEFKKAMTDWKQLYIIITK